MITALLLAAALPATPAVPARPPDGAWTDGAHRIEAFRDGEKDGRPHARLRDDLGRTFGASFDDLVFVRGDVSAIPDVEVVRTILPTRHIDLVRSLRHEDGLALATRLDAEVKAKRLEFANPNLWLPRRVASTEWTPDDPKFPTQWFFDRLHMADAWGLTTGAPTTTVAVVDTGCDATHEDLSGKLDPGIDVVSGDEDPTWVPGDGAAHGTACAGLVAADTNNAKGIAGTCPECRMRCVRLLGGDGEEVPTTADADAFEWIRTHDIAVASNSWGFTEALPAPTALAEAIKAAHDEGRGGLGTVIVFASGNDDRRIGAHELLTIDGILGVGALDRYDERISYSNYGNGLDVSAYLGTLTTDITGGDGFGPGDYTSNFNGTSSACPIVSGVAALVLSADPTLTSSQVDALLQDTAKPAPNAEPGPDGRDPYFGFGIVDPARALSQTLGIDTTDAGTPTVDAGGGGGGGDAPGCGCGGSPTFALLLAGLAVTKRPRSRS